MKKILFISNIAKNIGSFAMASIKASDALGLEFYQTANWSTAKDGQMEADERTYGIKIYHADISRSPFSKTNITAYRQIVDLIQKEHIHYIHCNTPVGGLLGRLAGKKCKVEKVIYQAHGFHFYKGAPIKNWLIFYPVERLLAHMTDAIVTMNREDFENSQKFRLRKKGKKYFVHGVGNNLSEYENMGTLREDKRRELNLKEDDIALISMGDLIARKNYATAIEAVAKANDPRLQYFICGKGDQLDNLKRLADELGVSEQIHFLGFRTDIKELLAAADMFLFTTLQEGLPRSMMEAMASGLPCVASKIRGNVDLIDDGVGGYLCASTDSDAFASAISAIANDEELRSSMRASNLETIKQYDISVVEKEIRDIYLDVFGDQIKE